MQCLDAVTGEHKWMKPLKGKFSASPVQVGNIIFCVSEEGLCYIIEIEEDGCEILNEIEMGEPSLSSPAIVDNTIYIRTNPHLWKISTR